MNHWYFEFSNGAYPYIIAIGLVFVVISAFYYRHTIPRLSTALKTMLFVFRALAIMAIALLMCFPTLVFTEEKTTGDKIAVMIDKSGSMGFEEDGITRMEKAKRLSSTLNSFGNRQQLLYFTFSDTLKEVSDISSIAHDSSLTSLSGAIQNLMKSEHALDIGGILLVSDGGNNFGSDPVFQSSRAGVPVSAIALGDTTPVPDISIDYINSPDIVYRGEDIGIEAVLKSDIDKPIDARLELYRGNRRIKTQNVLLPGGGSAKRIILTAEADSVGVFEYRLALGSDYKERFTANNYRSVSVNILKDRLNILLAGGNPSWNFSFLKKELEANDKYNISYYLPGKTPKLIFKPQKDGIENFDCVIFTDIGNDTYNRYGSDIDRLLDAGRLNAFFVLSPQSNTGRIQRLLRKIELLEENKRCYSTDGQFIPEVVNQSIPDALLKLPEGNSYQKFSSMPPLKYQLIGLNPGDKWQIAIKTSMQNARNIPALLHSVINGNRIVVFNGGPLWRWDFYMNRGEAPDTSAGIMIDNIITYLTVGGQSEPIDITTDKRLYSSGEQVNFRARMLDENYRPLEGGTVMVQLRREDSPSPSFEIFPVEKGNFEGSPGRLPAGDYSYNAYFTVGGDTLETKSGSFKVQSYSEEFRSLTANRELLRKIASASGGNYYDVENIDDLDIPKNQGSIKLQNPYRLASLPVILVIIIALLALEWGVRKRRQLP
ncbi:MAG: hypothetical protein GF307_03765 [candidate division Zixibacteria bacterium]|nr:hypothetical protein [candidate division Zixibacteria bacterium]